MGDREGRRRLRVDVNAADREIMVSIAMRIKESLPEGLIWDTYTDFCGEYGGVHLLGGEWYGIQRLIGCDEEGRIDNIGVATVESGEYPDFLRPASSIFGFLFLPDLILAIIHFFSRPRGWTEI
jgi:hypothetical protein